MNIIYRGTSSASSHPEATRLKKNKCESALGEEKQKEILDSIRYAKRIQSALLPNEKFIEKSLKKLHKKI